MSKEVNYPNSMYDVVDTVAPTVVSFINNILREEMPNCSYVFDPNLSYETAVKEFYRQNNFEGRERSPLPLFAYKRSPLRFPEDGQAPNKRVTINKNKKVVDEAGNTFVYTSVYAEYTLDFLYVNPNMEQIEQFEIAYLSEEGITGSKELEVEMPDLGVFKYFITWNPELLDLEISDEQNNYKGIVGSCVIRGFYFTFRGESKIILNIKQRINNYLLQIGDSDILSETEINGEL